VLGAAQGGEPPAVASQGAPDSVVIAAAGDLVCGTETPVQIPCLHLATAAVVRQIKPDALLLLGDLQYETGSLVDFQAFYEPAFGEFKSVTYPVPGNHEYFTPGAAGYFDYFNGVGVDSGRVGRRGSGYYSFNLGAWHVVALNSNCLQLAGGCSARSPQAAWLREDLKANRARCTLAFSHSSRFTSGEHGNDEVMRDLWVILHDAGVDVVLSAHDHDYERFRRQDAMGRSDEKRGIRAFVVGTGGKGTARFLRGRPNSEIRDNSSIGVLTMVLKADSYSWKFVSVPGTPDPLEDSGDGTCHE
jgi:3',5'-cyclic AMP phosphodiesterase CpdA